MRVYIVVCEYGAGRWVSIRKVFLDEAKAHRYAKANQDEVEEYEVEDA